MSLFSFGTSTHDTTVAPVDVAALVETYASLLFRVAHSVVRNAAEAEDIVQDTFVRVVEHRAELPAVRAMRPWLVRIAWNLALDRRRRIPTDQIDEVFAEQLADRQLSADLALADRQQLSAALRAIERLPAAERQVLLLTAIEELDIAEISAVLGKSGSATRALLFRARTRLRERLAAQGGRPA